jgi:hypothetical protein
MLHENRPQARFAELVKLHMQGRRFLDREQERKLLEEGVGRYGLTLEEATGLVRTQAEGGEIALEGDLGRAGGQLLRTMADRQGRISREDFEKVSKFYRMRAGASLSQADAERRVKRLMEELELQPRPSGKLLRTRRWYRAIEA